MFMRKKQQLILTVFFLASAFLLFFWWKNAPNDGHPSTAKDVALNEAAAPTLTHTPTNTSEWARRQALRKKTPSLESTVETFKESGNCLYYFIARFATNKDHPEEDTTPERRLLWQEVLKKTETLCQGANEETVARAFMVAVWEAAKQGDADAQSCFVISRSNFPTVNDEMSARYRKYLQTRYIEYAPSIIQSALERGDPYVADMLIYRHFPTGFVADNPRTEEMIPPPDPYLIFRAEQLALYRSSPESTVHANIKERLNRFIKLEILSDDEIIRAEDWAKTTFAREYANTTPIDPSKQTPCHSIAGNAP